MFEPLLRFPIEAEQRIHARYDEYLRWTDGHIEGIHRGWVDGEFIVFSTPTTRHQGLLGFLVMLVSAYAELFDLGVTILAPFEVRLVPGRVGRIPDLLLVMNEHRG